MKNFYFLLILSTLFTQFAFAQCPPLGFPDSGNTCPEAPILCENLDGYCNTINNNNQPQQFPGCSGQWILNNDEWFAFYAGTTTITIVVTPSNCTASGVNQGLQAGIYQGCGGPAMDLQCFCSTEPFTLTSNNYVVGEVYWFVLDGCGGDVCDYSIDVTVGSTVGVPPAPPGSITGPSSACGGNATQHSVQPVTGATIYDWALTPSGAGSIVGGNDTSINVEWSNNFSGVAELCLQVANLCYPNPNEVCQSIQVAPTPTATLSGGGAICSATGDSIALTVTFTGAGPWGFTPLFNGIPQAPVETSSNPYVFYVNQAGTWVINSVYETTLNCLGTTSGVAVVTFGPLTLSSNVTSNECGQNNGSIDLNVSGGTQPYTFIWSNSATTEDLDTLVGGLYTVTVSNNEGCTGVHSVTVSNTISLDSINLDFCAGDAVVIGGQVYTQSGTVVDTFTGSNGCDSIITYVLTLLPTPTRAQTIEFCPGESVVIGGQTYAQSGTVLDTLSASVGCDTIVTYTLLLLPQPTRAQTIEFCPGESAVIDGQSYTQAGIVFDTIAANIGCDTIATYTLVVLPQPTRAQTIKFCPGETIVLGGQSYTQAGIVTLIVPATTGCDTIYTYTLESELPSPSSVAIQCPNSINLIADPGTAPMVVIYNPVTATTDCPCPGLNVELTAGLASGALFPNGTTQVCYKATDQCGQSATCCFNVNIREIQPCDVKVIGCMRYELLSITADAAKNQTYRIRVDNNCPNKLIYTAIQLPDAVVATAPPHLSIFTSEGGRDYEVRNPNYSPFYSIRFKSIDDSISNGQSDIFKYTLPAQSDPDYIHITSRLYPQLFFEAHLNTFYCPVGVTRPEDRAEEADILGTTNLFPNPSSGSLWMERFSLTEWGNDWRIFNTQGQEMLRGNLEPIVGLQEISLPATMPNGLYFLELQRAKGGRETLRFVLQR